MNIKRRPKDEHKKEPKNKNKEDENNILLIKCPHCMDEIMINKNEINCAIFRHGVLIKNMEQINPHLCKEECDRLYNEKLIYGCGRPFKINNDIAEICDYI